MEKLAFGVDVICPQCEIRSAGRKRTRSSREVGALGYIVMRRMDAVGIGYRILGVVVKRARWNDDLCKVECPTCGGTGVVRAIRVEERERNIGWRQSK